MGIITWLVILGGMSFMVWYGFNLLVRRPGVDGGVDGEGPESACHLCRRSFPISRMIARDKMAGFVNYFCGDCIERLYSDYTGAFRDRDGAQKKVVGDISRN